MEFCVYCLKNVDVTIEEREEEINWRGEKLTCIQKYARCNECGHLVHVGELHDLNLYSVYDAYRAKKNIISYEDVLELATKYKHVASKRTLSKILGMGPHTFERFCNRYIPSKAFSNILKKLQQKGAVYLLEKLEEHRDSFKEEEYNKIKKKLSDMILAEQPPRLTLDLDVDVCEKAWDRPKKFAFAA